MSKTFIIGADRMAVPLKDAVKEHLEKDLGYEVTDVGMVEGGEYKAYLDTAAELAAAISEGKFQKGILMCGTGAGMTIVANKFPGVRAVLTQTEFDAEMSQTINDANVICMGAMITAPAQACRMADKFIQTPFKLGFPEDRHEFLENAKNVISCFERENAEKLVK